MNIRYSTKLLCALLTTSVLLAGCSTNRATKEQYSGFLKDYSGLQDTVSATGQPISRWIAPGFNIADYNKLIYNPIVYFPTPRPGPQVSQDTLNKVLAYTNNKLEQSLKSRFTLTKTPGPHTLVIRSAITAVNTSNESMQFYEVLPIAMVLAAGQVATGYRTQDTNIYFEAEVADAVTGEVKMKVVRKGIGRQLDNAQQPVTLSTLKTVIDSLATDARLFNTGKP